ncbi:ATP-binding protein [Embleya sp. MST-111070]|uniref:ATP-binding protein n=1 Tax=Embleya sp. MST-111070 TaxID=3398231 RepID=UPI003F73740F
MSGSGAVLRGLRATPRAVLRGLRGLRVRLAAACLLVAMFAALTTAALTYREARGAMLQRAQDSTVHSVRDRVQTVARLTPYPPDQAALERIAALVDPRTRTDHWAVAVGYRDLWATTNRDFGPSEIPTELRGTVAGRTATAFQRVHRNGRVLLAVGVPIAFSGPGRTTASGVEVYVMTPMQTQVQEEAALVRAARNGAIPAVLAALVLALIVAGGVLRPVRALQRATRRLARGRLDTRLQVKGGDELAELAQDFNHTAAALEEHDARLRRLEARARAFAADVSHELRTPLAAMTAVTDVLDEDAAAEHLDPDTAAALRLISSETGKLTRLVDDLMEISRFDARAAALHVDELDMAEAVRRCLAARGWRDAVTTRLPEGIRAEVDPRRLDVVVANLVGNALRHGAPPVEVALAAERRDDGDWVVLTVADRGPGLAAETLDRVFERFFKADAARTRSSGSGLGMAITLENVRLHDGLIRAANRPDGGAEFTVELPRHARVGTEGREDG